MSIDRAGAAVAPNQGGKSGAGVARAQPEAADPSRLAGAASFPGLLGSMESETEVTPEAAGVLVSDGQVPAPGLDPAALLAQNPNRSVKTGDLEAALELEKGLPPVAGQQAYPATIVDPADQQGVAAQMAQVRGKFALHTQASRGLKSHGVQTTAERDPGGMHGVALADRLAAQTALPVDDWSRPDQAAISPLPARNATLRVNEARAAADTAVADRRAAIATQSEIVSGAGATMWEAGAITGADNGGSNRGERSTLRPSRTSAGSALAGSWTDFAATASAPAATGTAFSPDAAVPVPETSVAEKVHYWITRGVQNAELQLDAFGGGSVEVSIAMTGNEALVEFRSDQPEARKLLQDALPHLKDMLKGEGLVLSGGFVGSSAQQDPGAQGRKGNSRGARAAAFDLETTQIVQTAGLGRTPGRAVDVFV